MLEGVPAVVGGFLGIVGAYRVKLPLPVKIGAVGAGVGVDPVQNYPDTPGVSLTAQLGKIRLGAQHGVGGFVVAGVVAVAGKAFGNGIQVEKIHAQIRNIVQFFDNSPEITAEKVVVEHQIVLGGTPVHLFVPAGVDGVGGQLAGGIAVAGLVEPVRENLINGCPSGPLGSVKVRRYAANLPEGSRLHIGVISLLEQPEAAAGGVNIIVVEIQALLGDGKLRLPDFVGAFDPFFREEKLLGSGAAVLILQQALDGGGLDGTGDVNVKTAGLTRSQGAEGFFELGKLAVV